MHCREATILMATAALLTAACGGGKRIPPQELPLEGPGLEENAPPVADQPLEDQPVDFQQPLASDRCNGDRTHCVWVAPFWTRAQGYAETFVTLLNPSGQPAQGACFFLDHGGETSFVDPVGFRIPSGASRSCRPPLDADFSGSGWVLIAADHPVFPDGHMMVELQESAGSRVPQTEGLTRTSLPFYPVNCADDEGEMAFVCEFLAARGI